MGWSSPSPTPLEMYKAKDSQIDNIALLHNSNNHQLNHSNSTPGAKQG
jgi:hypothetical protein